MKEQHGVPCSERLAVVKDLLQHEVSEEQKGILHCAETMLSSIAEAEMSRFLLEDPQRLEHLEDWFGEQHPSLALRHFTTAKFTLACPEDFLKAVHIVESCVDLIPQERVKAVLKDYLRVKELAPELSVAFLMELASLKLTISHCPAELAKAPGCLDDCSDLQLKGRAVKQRGSF